MIHLTPSRRQIATTIEIANSIELNAISELLNQINVNVIWTFALNILTNVDRTAPKLL